MYSLKLSWERNINGVCRRSMNVEPNIGLDIEHRRCSGFAFQTGQPHRNSGKVRVGRIQRFYLVNKNLVVLVDEWMASLDQSSKLLLINVSDAKRSLIPAAELGVVYIFAPWTGQNSIGCIDKGVQCVLKTRQRPAWSIACLYWNMHVHADYIYVVLLCLYTVVLLVYNCYCRCRRSQAHAPIYAYCIYRMQGHFQQKTFLHARTTSIDRTYTALYCNFDTWVHYCVIAGTESVQVYNSFVLDVVSWFSVSNASGRDTLTATRLVLVYTSRYCIQYLGFFNSTCTKQCWPMAMTIYIYIYVVLLCLYTVVLLVYNCYCRCRRSQAHAPIYAYCIYRMQGHFQQKTFLHARTTSIDRTYTALYCNFDTWVHYCVIAGTESVQVYNSFVLDVVSWFSVSNASGRDTLTATRLVLVYTSRYCIQYLGFFQLAQNSAGPWPWPIATWVFWDYSISPQKIPRYLGLAISPKIIPRYLDIMTLK